MAKAKQGDTVKVHYTGKFEDGTVFDSSANSNPLEFTLGEGQMIPGFEHAVIGMGIGESKTIKIPMDQAYGPHRKEMVFEFDRKKAPANFNPEVGQQIRMSRADGKIFMVTVVDISEMALTLDGNHPLAGKDLFFDIQLLEIA